jgi:hypothetical protein
MKVKPGDVFQIELPGGKFAYGRMYKDATAGIYSRVSEAPNQPPLGSRDFAFFVGIYEHILKKRIWKVIAQDLFGVDEDQWPPPNSIIDPITGECEIYHRGKIRPATRADCEGLEPAAVWDAPHVVDRILHGRESKYFKSLGAR